MKRRLKAEKSRVLLLSLAKRSGSFKRAGIPITIASIYKNMQHFSIVQTVFTVDT